MIFLTFIIQYHAKLDNKFLKQRLQMQTSLKIFVLGIWNFSPFKKCLFSYIGGSIKESGVLTLETIIEPRHVISNNVAF